MAWTHAYSVTGSIYVENTTYVDDNSPAFAGGGLILALMQDPALADGDVVVLTVTKVVYMPRDAGEGEHPTLSGNEALSTDPPNWTGVNTITKFPCIPASSSQQTIGSYGGVWEPSDYPTETYDTCNIRTWVFQITDAATHLTLGNWLINLDWDPGLAPKEWGDSGDADRAWIIGGASVFRSDTNPTWPIQVVRGHRGCGYISYPYAAMPDNYDVYVHIGAADLNPSSPPAVENGTLTEGWTKEDTDGEGIGLQYSFTKPVVTADWSTFDGYGASGADGGGYVAGSMHLAFRSFDPAEPPTDLAPVATSCVLHVPHKRWLENTDKSKAKFQIEQNWHEFEAWVRNYLTDDACRPCVEFIQPPA